MQQYIKLRNKSQHHITILTLLFWVWKPPKKPKMGKPVQQSYIDFIMTSVYNTTNSPKLGECSYTTESLEKPQLNLSTLLHECTTQLYEAR